MNRNRLILIEIINTKLSQIKGFTTIKIFIILQLFGFLILRLDCLISKLIKFPLYLFLFFKDFNSMISCVRRVCYFYFTSILCYFLYVSFFPLVIRVFMCLLWSIINSWLSRNLNRWFWNLMARSFSLRDNHCQFFFTFWNYVRNKFLMFRFDLKLFCSFYFCNIFLALICFPMLNLLIFLNSVLLIFFLFAFI